MHSDVTAEVCVIVRDEIRSIVEWIAYHKSIGFDAIRVYDNGSVDGTREVLAALAKAGELQWVDWPPTVGKRPQRLAYEHARMAATSDWLAFFDADEFLVLPQDATLKAFLARFDITVGAVAINWVVFGSDGHARYEAVPVIERYTDALGPEARTNRTIKTIARRASLTGTRVHKVALGQGRYVNAGGEDVEILNRTEVARGHFGIAALHHYAVKSLEEFELKRNKGDANSHDLPVRQAKLDSQFAEFNAGGDRNTDILARSAAMRVEALRLCAILKGEGLNFPVWPFVRDKV
jgi:hypothetical protein